jgi:hypothetical protein
MLAATAEIVLRQTYSIRRNQGTGQAISGPDYRSFDRQKLSPVVSPSLDKNQEYSNFKGLANDEKSTHSGQNLVK